MDTNTWYRRYFVLRYWLVVSVVYYVRYCSYDHLEKNCCVVSTLCFQNSFLPIKRDCFKHKRLPFCIKSSFSVCLASLPIPCIFSTLLSLDSTLSYDFTLWFSSMSSDNFDIDMEYGINIALESDWLKRRSSFNLQTKTACLWSVGARLADMQGVLKFLS